MTDSNGTWGELDGHPLQGGTYKFSGTRTGDRIIEHEEEVFFLVKAKGGDWTKVEVDSHGDHVRQIPLVIEESIECPEDMSATVAELIQKAIDDREGKAALPLGDPHE